MTSDTRLRSAACSAGTGTASNRRPAAATLHVHGARRPSSTAVYLTITPDLLDEANRKSEVFAEATWLGMTP